MTSETRIVGKVQSLQQRASATIGPVFLALPITRARSERRNATRFVAVPVYAQVLHSGNLLEGFVRESVTRGRYKSASEVVREALRLLQARDHATEIAELRQREVNFEMSRSQFLRDRNSKKD
jgi:putative addiction module CopG family antidote